MTVAEDAATAAVRPRETTYRPSSPVDLARTLAPLSRGRGDPTQQWDGVAFWRTALTPEGAATLRLQATGGSVEARAWGPGAEWALAQVPELCGRGDDWSGFDCTAHRLLRETRRAAPGLRLPRVGLVWEMLVPAVLEQKVTGKEARRSWRELLRRYGAVAPGPAPPGMRVCPPAEVWQAIPSWGWHQHGVGPERARTVVAAARLAPVLERTLGLGRGGAAVVAVLRQVPGIGAWTAAEVVQRAHGDPDTVSVGDFHLAALVGWALLGRPVDDDGMLRLLAPMAGHRHRAVRLVECSGFRKPRFGPRYSPLDHRSR